MFYDLFYDITSLSPQIWMAFCFVMLIVGLYGWLVGNMQDMSFPDLGIAFVLVAVLSSLVGVKFDDSFVGLIAAVFCLTAFIFVSLLIPPRANGSFSAMTWMRELFD